VPRSISKLTCPRARVPHPIRRSSTMMCGLDRGTVRCL
jgi:hypothetical protein